MLPDYNPSNVSATATCSKMLKRMGDNMQPGSISITVSHRSAEPTSTHGMHTSYPCINASNSLILLSYPNHVVICHHPSLKTLERLLMVHVNRHTETYHFNVHQAIYNCLKNSTIADKPRDVYVRYAMARHGWPPKTRPCPTYVCSMPTLVALGQSVWCGHK